MSGRHRLPRQYYDEPRGFRDDPPPPHVRARSISPRRLEVELSSRHSEMRRIREDNQCLADEIVNLRQTIPHVKEDIHVLSQAIPKHRAEKQLESRDLVQRNLKLEAELRALEPLRQDALHLRSEAGKLQSLKQELSGNVQGLLKELEHQKSESQKIPDMIAERHALREELIQTRY
jgi:predicted  nucleic acid-binding Zn-ribbon protein